MDAGKKWHPEYCQPNEPMSFNPPQTEWIQVYVLRLIFDARSC